MFNDDLSKNRKSQVFVIGIIISVTLGLLIAFIYLQYNFSEDPNTGFGSYQAGIVDTLIEADSTMSYLDHASHWAADIALRNFSMQGGVPDQNAYSDAGADFCGKFIYNLWNSPEKECYPQYRQSFGGFYEAALYDMMSRRTEPTFQRIMSYQYTYEPGMHGTRIYAFADDRYDFYIYRESAPRKDVKVQQYVASKVTYKSAVSGGDIPGVPYLNSPNVKAAQNRNIKYIVIHYTAGDTTRSALSRFMSPGGGASSHYIVGSTKDNYQVVQPVADRNIAWHAGCNNAKYGCSLADYKSINSESIGIEIVNLGFECGNQKFSYCRSDVSQHLYAAHRKESTPKYWQRYPAEQWKRTVALTALLSKRYNIPVDRQHILGHDDVVMKNKVDPGPAFDWNKFIREVNDAKRLDDAALISQINGGQVAAAATAAPSQTAANKEWTISNMMLLPDQSSYGADQKFRIVMTFENPGSNVATIVASPRIEFTDKLKVDIAALYWPSAQGAVDVYMKSRKVPYINSPDIECSFSADSAYVKSERAKGRCVLLAPSESSVYHYTIIPHAKDALGRDVNNNNLLKKITVTKAGLQTSSNPTPNNQGNGNGDVALQDQKKPKEIELTKSEQRKLDFTKRNLEKQDLLSYVYPTI